MQAFAYALRIVEKLLAAFTQLLSLYICPVPCNYVGLVQNMVTSINLSLHTGIHFLKALVALHARRAS